MNSTLLTKKTIIDFLTDLFAKRGAEEYLGEKVTMAQHMLQCAALAEQQQASDELIVAALLHDIGHFTSDFPADAYKENMNNKHDHAAADLLAPFYPTSVTEPIRLHVAAKRYLCAVESDYYEHLSVASVHSLNFQGGVMNEIEVQMFEQNPFFTAAVQVRHWDEGGKVIGEQVADFSHYLPRLHTLLV